MGSVQRLLKRLAIVARLSVKSAIPTLLEMDHVCVKAKIVS